MREYGYYTDAETGLVLCTFRYYDPNTGRWINRDPIGYAGGVNLYAYVMANPVNGVDPLGMAGGALTPIQRKEVQQAIDVLNWVGYTGSASRAQKMLDSGKYSYIPTLKGDKGVPDSTIYALTETGECSTTLSDTFFARPEVPSLFSGNGKLRPSQFQMIATRAGTLLHELVHSSQRETSGDKIVTYYTHRDRLEREAY